MNKFLTMVLVATALLTSCSNEDNGTENNSGDSSMRVKISYGSTTSTYALDTPLNAGSHTTLGSAILYQMTGTNVFKAIEMTPEQVNAMLSQTGCTIENINSAVDAVMIVGNPTGSTADMKLLKTKKAIEEYAIDVASQQGSGVTNVTIMGYGAAIPNGTATDGHNLKVASVVAAPVVARLEVAGKVSISSDATNNLKSITWKTVYFNRYYTTLTKNILQTYEPTTWNNIPSWAKTTYSSEVENKAKCFAYQFFPAAADKSSADVLPMIVMQADIVVTEDGQDVEKKGKYLNLKSYKKGNAALTIMEANKIYKVDLGSLTLSHEDFTDEPNPAQADLSIKVEIADWAVENITPEK